MKNKTISGILNSFFATAFIYTLIESVTYYGFLVKHFGNLTYVFALVIVLISFLFYLKFHRNNLLNNLIYVSTGGMLTTYVALNSLERMKYANYVFSHLHIHPDMLLLPLMILMLMFLLIENEKRIKNLFYALIFLVFCQYITNDFAIANGKNLIYIFKNLDLNYSKKMEMLIGKVPYDYAVFIRENTPENAVILIPPQAYPWPQTSNEAYLRYFVFPRKLINGGEKVPNTDISKVDYVLLDYGETNTSQFGYTNIWPKFNVPAEFIIYWNPTDGKTYQDLETVYRFDSNDKTEKWGIIKVDKSKK